MELWALYPTRGLHGNPFCVTLWQQLSHHKTKFWDGPCKTRFTKAFSVFHIGEFHIHVVYDILLAYNTQNFIPLMLQSLTSVTVDQVFSLKRGHNLFLGKVNIKHLIRCINHSAYISFSVKSSVWKLSCITHKSQLIVSADHLQREYVAKECLIIFLQWNVVQLIRKHTISDRFKSLRKSPHSLVPID